VQSAKDQTDVILKEFEKSRSLPAPPETVDATSLLAAAKPGDYLAITAFIRQTPETDEALNRLRQKVMDKHRIATTVGYGPRFLHSTGQLHKGGPGNGLFLQLTAPHERDFQIPGRPYSFGTLADAQARGDLQALLSRGRRVASVELGTDVVRGLERALEGIG
jgi:hypothetical protein